MTEPTRDVASRWIPPPELLRELPDLLTGKDPELLRPEARAWMLRDPRAREYADQISGAVALLADLPRRVSERAKEPLEKRARRGVERAARQLPSRLAEVLWPLLTLDLNGIARTNKGVVYFADDPNRLDQCSVERLEQTRGRILEQMESSGYSSITKQVRAVSDLPLGSSFELGASARRSLEVLRVLLPTSLAVELASLVLDYQTNRPFSIESWRRLLDRSDVEGLRSYVVAGLGLALGRGHHRSEAVTILESGMRDSPSSCVVPNMAYVGGLAAATIGNERAAMRFVDRFETAFASMPCQANLWRRILLIDADEWVVALNRCPRVVARMFGILGGDR